MEIHAAVNHASAKRLWNVLRIAFFMIRKGLSKRKLLVDMHLMMKRGKVCGRTLRNFMFSLSHGSSSNNHSSSRGLQPGFGLQEYEFSCSNSPCPVQWHLKKKHSSFMQHFSCINGGGGSVSEEEELGYSDNNGSISFSFPQLNCANEFFSKDNLEAGQLSLCSSPMLSSLASPYSRRQSNFSQNSSASVDEEQDHQVDRQAEEFIAKFYEQLRMQHQQSVKQYHDMINRGAA